MRARLAVVDLLTGEVYGEAADLSRALDDLDNAEFFIDDDEEDEKRERDLAVVDLDRDEMCQVDAGEITWCWWDAFTGRWRRRLEPVGEVAW